MSESPPDKPIDRKLQAEASLYGIPYKAYVEMTPRERSMAKAQWVKRLKGEARRRNLDPDTFVAMTEEEREAARAGYPEKTTSEPPRAPRRERKGPVPVPTPEREPEAPREPVSTQGDLVPPTEADPARRTQVTVGHIAVKPGEDLVGLKPPERLEDIYSRWPIGDGQHYLRVDRREPKVYERIACAGYLGKIEHPITEEQFQRYFGGRLYDVTLYGPDPKGRHDPNTGLPIIKAKTEPFQITVPILPPNLRVLPAAKTGKKEEVEAQMGHEHNPFATLFGSGAGPATPAEATMHRANIDFFGQLIKRGEEEARELRKELDKRGNMSDGVLRVIGDANRQAFDAATQAAQAREQALHESLKEERRKIERLEEKLEALGAKPSGDDSTYKTLQLLNPREAAAEALNAARERHSEEVRHLRETNTETMRALKERHSEEVGRERDRYRDMEDHYRRKIEDIEKSHEKREKELKEEIDRVRRDEREVAERRVKETENRFEDRLRDVKEQHERELRLNKEHAETRLDTQKTTLEFQRQSAEERAQAAREEAERARQEAEDAKDPIKVKENAERLAEAFGYSKADENAPQTPGERLAAGVGLGIGRALENAQEWVPKTLQQIAEIRSGRLPPGAPGAPQLPPGMTPQQAMQRQQQAAAQAQAQAQAQQPRRRRAVAWASQGGIASDNQPQVPQGDVGVRPSAVPDEAPKAPDAPPAGPQPEASPPPQTQNGAAAAPAAVPMAPELLARLQASGVTPEYVLRFRREVEMAIDTGFAPELFAERFAEAYPDASRELVSRFQPKDLADIIRAMGGADSSILRRDGKKWLESMWEATKSGHSAAPEPAPAESLS